MSDRFLASVKEYQLHHIWLQRKRHRTTRVLVSDSNIVNGGHACHQVGVYITRVIVRYTNFLNHKNPSQKLKKYHI